MVVPADSIKEVLTWICGRPSRPYITGVGAGCTIRFICLCSTWWWTFLRWLALGWFAAAYTNRIILYISDLQYSLARDFEPYCIPIAAPRDIQCWKPCEQLHSFPGAGLMHSCHRVWVVNTHMCGCACTATPTQPHPTAPQYLAALKITQVAQTPYGPAEQEA
jgi:hypothetical protein